MDVEKDFERVANQAVQEAGIIDRMVGAVANSQGCSEHLALELLVATDRLPEVLSKARRLKITNPG